MSTKSDKLFIHFVNFNYESKLLGVVTILLLILDVVAFILLSKLRRNKNDKKLRHFINWFAAICAIVMVIFAFWYLKDSTRAAATASIAITWLFGSIVDFVCLISLLVLVAYQKIGASMISFAGSFILKIAMYLMLLFTQDIK